MILRSSIWVAPRSTPGRRENGRHPHPLAMIWLEDRVLLSGVLNDATTIPIGSWSAGGLSPGGADFYRIDLDADGLLTAEVHAESASLQLRLSLLDGQGNLLVQSDGQSLGEPDPMVDQHLTAGAAYLEVQGLSGSGTFVLSTALTPSSDPGQTVALPAAFLEGNYAPIAVGDFTNNGILDIVAPDGVHPGTGDGTFGSPSPTGALVDPTQDTEPSAIAVGDFNGDGDLDAAVALAGTDSVSISLGNGDGTFQSATTIGLPPGGTPAAIVAGDFGTGQLDLAVADSTLNVVYILQGNNQGSFQLASTVPVGLSPDAIAEGDFEGNGRTDLAVADMNSGDVTILLNDGDGTFTPLPPIALPAGSTPTAIVAGDFGTGHVDLAVADSSRDEVDILLGNGDGTFRLGSSVAVGANPYAIVAGDFGNGQIDLATADANSNDVSVLLGNGDGTFQPALDMAAGETPLALVAGDFNGDGRLDLATGNAGSNDISVLLGKGDGTFEEPEANLVGYDTAALATGDFTGNGNLGVAVVNQGSDSVNILPGNGDGTFQQPLIVPLPQGGTPSAIVAADFNGDGRPDLAVADPTLDEVDILMGNGDGTFQALPPIPVAGGPDALAEGDFTGDGHIDLAVADRSFSTVTILLGNGDGTFQALPPIQLGEPNNPPFPDAIVAGNFVDGGPLDLAVADEGTDDVTILVGKGNGTFQVAPPISLGGGSPSVLSLVTGDFNDDGRTDLAVASTDYFNGDSIDVLLGNGGGTFRTLPPIPLGLDIVSPVAIVAGDFNDDGNLDLATADANGDGTDDYSIYLGNGDGTFRGPTPYPLGGPGYSTAIATGSFTNDGRSDLAIARTSPDDVQVRLGNGDGTFSDPAVTDLVLRDTPLVADVNDDGTPDVSVVDAAGDILFRAGRPGEPGNFAPPITVNPGDPSRDIALVDTDLGPLIASVDADDDAISFFAWRSTGFVEVASLATGSEPAQILSADLDGDGRTDLLVRNAGDGTLSLFQVDKQGWFLPPVVLPIGLGASDMEVADLQRDGRLDIVVTNRLSGEVEVLQNLGGGAFAAPVIEQAGRGPYGVTGEADPSPVWSLEGTTSVTSGVFTPGGLPSLVALNPGSETFGLLSGLGDDRLSNPAIFPTPADPLVVQAIDFNGDGLSGLAILTSGGLYIERSNGRGGFLPPTEIDVGFEPNGLTVADLNGDGKPDLLVSNPLGDVLVLLGHGDGTFQAPRSVDQQVALAVESPSGTSPGAFIFADQLTNQVVVQTVGGGTTVLADTSTGLVSPGAVKLADLNNNGILDLIVANSGSNNVLVYPGLGNGTFGPALNGGHGFFTGTNPVGITVADVNGDRRPDLIIANKGSNTVSILINEKVGNGFTFVPGPRLAAGDGPVATVVADIPGSPLPDLLVADSGSNQVRLLQGIGNGFFNDQEPMIYPVGADPSALYFGQFLRGSGPSLATVNSGSNTVTLISGLGTVAPAIETTPSGGIDPTTGLAVDLPGSDLESLVVANNGDGNISLLTPGEDGLAVSSIVSSAGVPNPSALALAGFNGGGLEFYATSEGEASATLLGFPLEESGGGVTSGLPPTLSESSSSAVSAQLVSLNESSLSLVGTLLTITLNAPFESEQTAEGSAAQVGATGSGPSAGQGANKPIGTPDEQAEETGGPVAQLAVNAPIPLPWARYVTGVDQALEDLRREADERLRQEQQPTKPEVHGPTILDRDQGPRETDEATSRARTEPVPNRASGAGSDRPMAVDAAMVHLVNEEPTSMRSRRPAVRVATTAGPLAPPPLAVEGEEGARSGPCPADANRHRSGIRAATSIAALSALHAAAARATESRSRRISSRRGPSGPEAIRGATEGR